MEKCSIFPYANPKGWHYTSRERAEGEWTCDHEEKKIATYNGCPLGSHMDWVPYPVHMGPRFAGPITALRAFKKKKVSGCAETLGSRLVKLRFNSGQIRCKPSQNVRLDPGLHGATTKWNRAPATSTKPKI